jgi:hypothetical protein
MKVVVEIMSLACTFLAPFEVPTDVDFADFQRTQSGSSWISWFGSYSATVARVVNNMQLEAAIDAEDSTKERPSVKGPRENTEPVRRKCRKLRIGREPDEDEWGTVYKSQEGGLMP